MRSFDQAVDYTAKSLAVSVGEALLKQTAMLLPQLYATFKRELETIVRVQELTMDGELLNHTWLRNILSSFLQHHMTYRCAIPKYGTLIYRYGGDLVRSLTVALGQAQPTSLSETNDSDSMLIEVCQTLNSKLRHQINKMISDDSLDPHRIENFNVDVFINSMDPSIWRAICLITQTASKKLTHVQKMRMVFTLCQICFTINRQCSFHTLLADIIDTYGGSLRLKTIFNRLGVCVSTETHARYVQYRVVTRQKEGPLVGLHLDCPVIISADNLDCQQSFSRVYSGNQTIGWHGTTVQIVLPDPTPTELTHISSSSNTSLVKRLYSTHAHSPQKTLPSPCPKKARRQRTGIEDKESESIQDNPSSNTPIPVSQQTQSHSTLTLTIGHFMLEEEEKASLHKLTEVCEQYILLKLANEINSGTLTSLQMYYCLSYNVPTPKKSTIVYYKVLDQTCDNKETLLSVINDLYTEFIHSGRKTHVVLEGDQATYERLHSLRAEYGNETSWLILLPGDWHFLKNYQEVLIKVYFDGGLSELAKASGYLPRSKGTNFKRTHRFILESWEALFRVLMRFYVSKQLPHDIVQQVSALITNFPQSVPQHTAHMYRNLTEMVETIREKISNDQCFQSYINIESVSNPTLKFWADFLLKDCLAYIALFLAIQSGNWSLRMAALKQMAPVFTAFDRPKYSKLIPLHIKEMLSFPEEIKSHLSRSGFSVSILGRTCHSVGVDEAHEMCINKECKEYIIRPSGENMNRTALFLPVRAKAIKNLETQLFADSKAKTVSTQTSGLLTNDPDVKKHEVNVRA